MNQNILRNLLSIYRHAQYAICRRYRHGVMPPGKLCSVEAHEYDINHGDIVHPCVRYVPEGYLGHKWWLIYTPYYKSDASLENPILCVGESNTEEFPKSWKFYCDVCKGHVKGYNSDPNLLYDKGRLYVFWRENQTNNCVDYDVSRATFAGIVEERNIRKIATPILIARDEHLDNEVSPAFIRFKDNLHAYATSVQFFSPKIRKLPRVLKKIINPSLLILDLLGLYRLRKSFGIARWLGSDPQSSFNLSEIKIPRGKNALYQPWHIDVFEYEDVLYAVIQSNQCNADIILAKSDDGENFTIFKKPLITITDINKTGIYKPSAIVVNGQFILLYTAQDYENRSLNKLYFTSCNFKELLSRLR